VKLNARVIRTHKIVKVEDREPSLTRPLDPWVAQPIGTHHWKLSSGWLEGDFAATQWAVKQLPQHYAHAGRGFYQTYNITLKG